jgi:hypothetical protein
VTRPQINASPAVSGGHTAISTRSGSGHRRKSDGNACRHYSQMPPAQNQPATPAWLQTAAARRSRAHLKPTAEPEGGSMKRKSRLRNGSRRAAAATTASQQTGAAPSPEYSRTQQKPTSRWEGHNDKPMGKVMIRAGLDSQGRQKWLEPTRSSRRELEEV